MALAQHLWTRCCEQRFYFLGEIRQNEKNNNKIKGIFCRRFLETLKKQKMAIKVEVLSWFCQI
jgi:hypothetical protein